MKTSEEMKVWLEKEIDQCNQRFVDIAERRENCMEQLDVLGRLTHSERQQVERESQLQSLTLEDAETEARVTAYRWSLQYLAG